MKKDKNKLIGIGPFLVNIGNVEKFFADNKAEITAQLNKPDPMLPSQKDNETVKSHLAGAAKVNYADHPIKEGQTLDEFVNEQAQTIVQEKLKAKLVEMFSKPKPVAIEKVGDDLYICDTIYDAYEEDEDKGKSAKVIAEIVQNKIRDYLRLNSDYEYVRSEYNFFPDGQMRLVFHFTKLKLKVWDL